MSSPANMSVAYLNVIEELRSQGLYRELKAVEPLPSGLLRIDGQTYLNLSGNDYLGLSQHPALKEAAQEAIGRFGVGAGASRLITGNNLLYEKLEEKVALFKKKEASLVFSSGYMANIGVLTALAGRETRVYSDELNHASIIDGLKMAKAKIHIYRHGDLDHLEELLGDAPMEGQGIIVTDTVFSMDGDVAPLAGLVALKKRYNCLLVVDEAHATGVLGREGRGAAEEFGVEEEIDVTVGTFSKALGSYGAYVAACGPLIELLTNRARSLIYTTALPPSVLAANLAAIEVLQNQPELRASLKSNSRILKKGLVEAGFTLLPSEGPILPLLIGDSRRSLELSSALFDEGIVAKAIRPPTVPEGTARIRITVSAAHRPQALMEAVEAFAGCGARLGII